MPQNAVFVLDAERNPLAPCHPARARELLGKGRAVVFRRTPFTIILPHRSSGEVQPLRLKIDPGAKVTGLALVRSGTTGEAVVWAAELTHRCGTIKERLADRRARRRRRRQARTRYRPARWANRVRSVGDGSFPWRDMRDAMTWQTGPDKDEDGTPKRRRRVQRSNRREAAKGWLPPSLMSRLHNTMTWVRRLAQLAPISGISFENVRFDTQLMENPEIADVEYQQGALQGYTVREYLLDKWGRRCAYCKTQNVPLEIEHIIPKARGGSDRIGNLTVACHQCNQKKGTKTAAEFGYSVLEPSGQSLKAAANINATRNAIWALLNLWPVEIEAGSGARTKMNRISQGYPKAHWIDAACVGESGASVRLSPAMIPLQIRAMGHGSRQKVIPDKYGFPKTHKARAKFAFGYQTGDIVEGTSKGRVVRGRVTIRQSGAFKLGQKGSLSARNIRRVLHRADGYAYDTRARKSNSLPASDSATPVVS